MMQSESPSQSSDVWIIGRVDDNRLRCNEETFVIEPDSLLLDGLLKLRDKWASAAEILDAGGVTLGFSGFRDRIKGLQKGIGALVGTEEVILTDGPPKHRKYQLAPQLDFVDERDDPACLRYKFGVIGDLPSYETYDGERRIMFASSKDRRKLFEAMCQRTITEGNTSPGPSANLLRMKVRDLREYMPPLPPEDLLRASKHIEEGMIAFLQPTQNRRTQAAAEQAITAYQRILLSIVPQVKRISVVCGLRYQGAFDDELFQEGCLQAINEALDLGASPDLANACEYFYAKCEKAITYKMWQASQTRLQKEKALSENEYELLRRITIESDLLTQELSREPSPAEIAMRLGESEDKIAYAMLKMEVGGISIDLFEDGNFLAGYGFKDTIDKEIDLAYQQELIEGVFLSPDLSENEKIIMSLRFGIYSSALCGAVFSTRMRREPFVYPYSEEDFISIIKEHDRIEGLAKVVKYDPSRLAVLLKGALKKSHTSLSQIVSAEDLWG